MDTAAVIRYNTENGGRFRMQVRSAYRTRAKTGCSMGEAHGAGN